MMEQRGRKGLTGSPKSLEGKFWAYKLMKMIMINMSHEYGWGKIELCQCVVQKAFLEEVS